jgi:hypothetical protein
MFHRSWARLFRRAQIVNGTGTPIHEEGGAGPSEVRSPRIIDIHFPNNRCGVMRVGLQTLS